MNKDNASRCETSTLNLCVTLAHRGKPPEPIPRPLPYPAKKRHKEGVAFCGMFHLSKKQKSLLVSLVHFQWNREGFREGPFRTLAGIPPRFTIPNSIHKQKFVSRTNAAGRRGFQKSIHNLSNRCITFSKLTWLASPFLLPPEP